MDVVSSPTSRSRTGSLDNDARSRAGSGGRAIGAIFLVAAVTDADATGSIRRLEPNASDLPTVETSAPHVAGEHSGVQIVSPNLPRGA